MVILDSSCWLEYFLNGIRAESYASIIKEDGEIIIPSIVLHETFKVAMQAGGEDTALAIAGVLQRLPSIYRHARIRSLKVKSHESLS